MVGKKNRPLGAKASGNGPATSKSLAKTSDNGASGQLAEFPPLSSAQTAHPKPKPEPKKPAALQQAATVSGQRLESATPKVESPDEGLDKQAERQMAIASIKFVSNHQPRRLPNVPSKQVLDNEAARIQEQISNRGNCYVTWNEIIYELMNKYQSCKDLGDLGLAKADDLNSIRLIIRLQHFIDSFVQMYIYVKSESCLILRELESLLVASMNAYFYKDRAKLNRFLDFKMGPFIKNCLVAEVFKFNELSDDEVKKLSPIEFKELMKSVENYLQRTKKWSDRTLDIEELEEFLLKKYQVPRLNLLGVKLTTGKEILINLKKIRHSQSSLIGELQADFLDRKREALKSDLSQLVSNGLQNYARFDQLIREANSSNDLDRMIMLANEFDSYSVKYRYLQSGPVSVLEEIQSVLVNLLDLDEASNQGPNKTMQNFLKELKKSDYFVDVFQLAICLGNTNLNVCLNNIIEHRQQAAFNSQISKAETKPRKGKVSNSVNSRKEVNSKEYTLTEYTNYQNLLLRLLSILLESTSYSHSTDELKSLLNECLKSRNMQVWETSDLQSSADSKQTKDHGTRNYLGEKLVNHLEAMLDAYLRDLAKRNHKSKHLISLDAFLEMDKYMQEQRQFCLDDATDESNVNFSFLEFLSRNQSLFKKHKLYSISLVDGAAWSLMTPQLGDNKGISNRAVNQRERRDFMEYLRQVKSSLEFEEESNQAKPSESVFNDSATKVNEKLESFCCNYFRLKQFEEMGLGPLSLVLKRIERRRGMNGTEEHGEWCEEEDDDWNNRLDDDGEDAEATIGSGFIYLDSLLNYDDCHFIRSRSERKMSPDFVQATKVELLKKLFECPLLENIEQYVRWRQNNYGSILNADLKQFIGDVNREGLRLDSIFDSEYLKKRGLDPSESISLDVLEIEPHGRHLVKLTRGASFDSLKSAISGGDFVQASGLLVSLIALNYGSLRKCSRLLLVNEMQSGFQDLLQKSADMEAQKEQHPRTAQINLNGLLLNDLEKFYLSLNDKNELFIDKTHKHFYSFLVEFIYRLPSRMAEQLLHFCLIDSIKGLFENDSQAFYEYLFVALVIDKFRQLLVDCSQAVRADEDLTVLFDSKKYCNNKNSPETETQREKCIARLVELLSLDDKIEHFLGLGKAGSVNQWSRDNMRSILGKLVDIVRCYSSPTVISSSVLKPNAESPITDQTSKIQNEPSVTNETTTVLHEQQVLEPLALENAVTKFQAASDLAFSTNEKLTHITEIRRRYGADVIMNDGERFITESLKGVLGRSIESLSSELYNKDLHFVLELIQNADDNSYEKIDSSPQSEENPGAEALIDESMLAFKFKHEPTLVFIFEEDCIILFNNETGFEMKNIEALCNIKSSTKGKYQRGCIGRKGIGFKSVFTITNRPEIHSNGYHVKFDLDANGKIGYILPTWIDDSGYVSQIASYQSHLAQKLENKFHELASSSLSDTKKSVGALNTCIKLPLKSHKEFEHDKSTLLKNSSNAIRPYLLLFLNRLKNLVVIIQDKSMESALSRLQGSGDEQGQEVSQFKIEHFYFRNDLNENLVEICCESKKYLPNGDSIRLESSNHKWIVLRKCLSIPENVKPSDTNVESTDLCLAFPLEQLSFDKTRGLQRGQPLKKMDVFAYLPLRPFGFSFIIQADFVVPASRQDVRQDSVWNQWLCKQIPALFVDSLELFKHHHDFADQIDALKAYLKFIPLEEEILGFFQHIPRQILELLCSREFLPAIEEKPDESEGYQIVWKKPSECIILRDKFIREVLTSDLLKMSLGRYYLHPDLIDYISEENLTNLVHSLGVKTLNLGDILKILNSIFAAQAGKSSEDDQSDSSVMKYDLNDLKTTAKWLVILQHLLSNCSSNDRDRLLKDIKQLPFIPIKAFKNGSVHREFSSLSAVNIFMPIKLSTSIENKKTFQKNLKNNSLQSKQPSSAGTSSDQFVTSFEAIMNRIQKYLNLLDFEALFCLDESSNNKLMSLFETLGVRRVMPREVIESHIVPKLIEYKTLLKQQQSQTQAYEGELVDYLVYIHDVWALSKRHDQNNTLLLGNYYLNDETIISELKDLLWLKTNKGLKQPRDLNSTEDSNESIFLSSEFDPQYQLATLFPSYPWCFVDPIYFKSVMNNLRENSKQKFDGNSINDKLRSNWKHFLQLIGVGDMFSPALKRFVFTRSELENVTTDLSRSDLRHSLKLWYSKHLELLKNLRSDEAFLFEDYECKVFNFYAEKIESATAEDAAKPIPESLKSELSNLFIVIHDNWSPKETQNNPNRHSSSLTAPLNSYRHARVRIVKKSSASGAGYNLQNAYPYKDPFCESIFFRNLKEKRWIQAEFSKFQPVFNYLGQATSAHLEMLMLYEQPSKIYLRDQTISRHYGHFMVPFLSESLNAHFNKRLLINNSPDYLPIELGFNYKFDLDEFIQLLKSRVFIKDTFFVASIKQMKLIYSCLKDAIQNDFRSVHNSTETITRNYPYIFVPQAKLDTKYNRSEEYVIGLFYTNREVCWRDPLQLFEKYSKVKLSLQAELSTEDHVFECKFMNQTSFQLIQGIYADSASSNDEETARDDHYGYSNENLESLFVKTFKLRQAPNLEHYVDLLEFIVVLAMLKLKEESVEAENKSSSIRSNMFHIFLKSFNLNEILVDIFTIFSDFGRRFDAFKMDKQREYVKINLLNAIGNTPILPCFNNQFKSFAQMFERDLPVLADNLDLGKLFIYKLNMVIIPSTRPSFMSRNISSILDSGTKKLDQQEQALKQIIQLKQQNVFEPLQEDFKQPSNQLSIVEEDQQTFADVCSLEHLDDFARIFLVEVLGLKMFSKIISLDLNKIETENLRPAPVVQNLLAKAVPFIQCFIYWRREYKSIYQLLSQDQELALDKRLKETRFYSVKELNTIYRCTFDSTIKAELSNKTIMDSTNAGGKRSYWIYYVRHDQLEDKRELVKGFLKLFIPKPSQEKVEMFQALSISNDLLTSFEEALTTFCLYSIFPYLDKSLKKKDQEIIEKDLKVKFSLPDEEVKWQIDEVKEPTIEKKVPSTTEKTKDGNENQETKEKPKKAPAETRKERALREKEKLKEALKLSYLSQSQINAPSLADEKVKSQLEPRSNTESVETTRPADFDLKAHQIYMNAYDEVEKPAEIKDQEAEKESVEHSIRTTAEQKPFQREKTTDQAEQPKEKSVKAKTHTSHEATSNTSRESTHIVGEQPKTFTSQDETSRDLCMNTSQVSAPGCSVLSEWINEARNVRDEGDTDKTVSDGSRKRSSNHQEPSKEFRNHEMVTYKYQNGEMKVQLRERDYNFVKPLISVQEPELIEFSVSDWSTKALDDLNKVVMPLDQLEALGIRAKLEKIGRWGEMWVFEVLKQRYKREIAANEMRVVWLNEETETGLPYDFIVIDMNRLNRLTANDSSSCPEELEIKSEDVRFYIEVKTTTKMNREYFFISYNELMFAKSHAEKFLVYRLYNGYNDPAQTKLKEISDIPAHLHSHQIKLFMYI